MARSTLLFCAAAALALAAVASAELIIRRAGATVSYGPALTNGAKLCPADYATSGFSIECRNVAGPVQFYVGSQWVRTENVAPYMIAGDSKGIVYKWTAPDSDFTVECHYGGKKISANVKIFCPPPVAAAKSVSATKSVTAAAAAASPAPAPTQTPTPLPTQAPSPPPMTMSKGNNCIKIKGNMNMVNNRDLPNGWTVDGTSVWYRKGSKFGGVVPGGTSDLEYMFVSPMTGTFGITLNMTTHEETDFNDCWLKFRYGLNLMKEGKPTISVDGNTYVKAYHNKNGTAVAAWSVDNDFHAISTGTPLRAGMMYKITVGARSANLKLNSIVMFPCEGDQCTPESPAWGAGVATCA